jgi:hypothetical protein
MMFGSYKNFMKRDVTYMQNRHMLEGWLFANFPFEFHVSTLNQDAASSHIAHYIYAC